MALMMNFSLTPPAVASTNNKQVVFGGVKLVSRKRTGMSLSCKYDKDFTYDKEQDRDFSKIIRRLELQDYLDEKELHKHLANLGDIVWELRIRLGYEYKDGKFILTRASIHGLWKSHIKNGKVVSDLDDDVYAKMKPRAVELAKKVLKIPGMSAKLEKIWKPTNHTSKLKEFLAHEMAKHGFLSLWYFVITLEAASPYFDEDGNFMLLKVMEEMGYEQGKFKCSQFQSDFTKRLGYKILMTYGDKKEKGRLYPRELGVLLGGNINKMDYILPPNDVDQDSDPDEFFLDGIDITV